MTSLAPIESTASPNRPIIGCRGINTILGTELYAIPKTSPAPAPSTAPPMAESIWELPEEKNIGLPRLKENKFISNIKSECLEQTDE